MRSLQCGIHKKSGGFVSAYQRVDKAACFYVDVVDQSFVV